MSIFAMSGVTELLLMGIVLTIDWDYTCFAVKISKAFIDMHDDDARTVRYVYARRRFVTMAETRLGLTTLNSSNFVVYCQKHKVWVLVFLVSTRSNIHRTRNYNTYIRIFTYALSSRKSRKVLAKIRCFTDRNKRNA